jgi:hypothetical protein
MGMLDGDVKFADRNGVTLQAELKTLCRHLWRRGIMHDEDRRAKPLPRLASLSMGIDLQLSYAEHNYLQAVEHGFEQHDSMILARP